jgi:RNA polymerase-binding transcription factor DksA
MPSEQGTYAALTRVAPARAGGPYWRAILEYRWRKRLQEVTELSIAYHSATGPGPDSSAGGAGRHQSGRPLDSGRLLRRAVAARRRLADTDEALGRLAAGSFGRCEQCGSLIPDWLLAAVPETRYCPGCAAPAVRPAEFAGGAATRESRR